MRNESSQGGGWTGRRGWLWTVLAAMAAVALLMAIGVGWSLLRPQEVALGPQQTVATVNPKIGVHTRLTDEVEEWKVKRTLEMVREMGSPWIVEYFPWAYVEAQPGRWDWSHSDMVIQHAKQQGLQVVARLGYVPEWARPKETTPLYLDEEHFVDFGEYAAEFAKRYADSVDQIVIWNEPNLALEWGYALPDAARYTEMLRVVYPMIKAANPNVEVLAGALAPTNAPPESTEGVNDLVFLQQMYDAGAAPFFDILAIHSYGWSSDPDEPADPNVINFRRSELLRQIMVDNGDAAKRAMITEAGWNDHPRWTRAVRPAQRIAWTQRAYASAEEWEWLDALAMWVFRFPWEQKSYQDYYTFVRPDFAPRPIYDEVARYARGEVAAPTPDIAPVTIKPVPTKEVTP